jgi:hypothetical protein
VALQSMTALKSMSLEKLMKLKGDVEATLTRKVSEGTPCTRAGAF